MYGVSETERTGKESGPLDAESAGEKRTNRVKAEEKVTLLLGSVAFFLLHSKESEIFLDEWIASRGSVEISGTNLFEIKKDVFS